MKLFLSLVLLTIFSTASAVSCLCKGKGGLIANPQYLNSATTKGESCQYIENYFLNNENECELDSYYSDNREGISDRHPGCCKDSTYKYKGNANADVCKNIKDEEKCQLFEAPNGDYICEYADEKCYNPEFEVEAEVGGEWDYYIDEIIAHTSGHCDKAAITGKDGSKWTSNAPSNALRITPSEAKVIGDAFKAGNNFLEFQKNGIVIEGVKYQFMRGDGNIALGKNKGVGAISMQATKTAVVIGHTKEGGSQGNTIKGVGVIAEYLESLGMSESESAVGQSFLSFSNAAGMLAFCGIFGAIGFGVGRYVHHKQESAYQIINDQI